MNCKKEKKPLSSENKYKFVNVSNTRMHQEIERITIGRSLTYPDGWVYLDDLEEAIRGFKKTYDMYHEMEIE